MNRRLKRVGIMAISVALAIIGFSAITKAIEADINNSMAANQFQPQLVSEWEAVEVVESSDKLDRQKCAPAGHRDARAMGEKEGTHGLYQIWWYRENEGRFYREVSLAFGARCGVAYSEQFDEAITNRVPLGISRSLTLQFYSSLAEDTGGIDAYRSQLLSSFVDSHNDNFIGPGETVTEHSKIEINSVDIWALRQLDIHLPADAVTVIDIDDDWSYEHDPDAI